MDDIGLETIAVSAEENSTFGQCSVHGTDDGPEDGPEDGPIERFLTGLAEAGFPESDRRRILLIWLESSK